MRIPEFTKRDGLKWIEVSQRGGSKALVHPDKIALAGLPALSYRCHNCQAVHDYDIGKIILLDYAVFPCKSCNELLGPNGTHPGRRRACRTITPAKLPECSGVTGNYRRTRTTRDWI